jgi:hypothetical protein
MAQGSNCATPYFFRFLKHIAFSLTLAENRLFYSENERIPCTLRMEQAPLLACPLAFGFVS